MLEWFRSSPICVYLGDHYTLTLFLSFFPLTVFFLTSHRMNARLEAATTGPQLLLRLSQTLVSKNPTGQQKAKKMLSLFLQKLNWLLADKLKFLPDVHTGRRTNFIWLLLAACMVMMGTNWIAHGSTAHEALVTLRYADASQARQIRTELWGVFFLFFLSMVLFILPFLFARKNREFYLDVWVLFVLLHVSLQKLFNCWYWDCCFGIPWSGGVYNAVLETRVFPVQLAEFAVGLLLCAICILYMLYGRSYRPGYGCSVCLISYAVPRFFWDYLRYLGEGYRPVENFGIFGLTIVQTVCIAAVILGIAWLFVLPLEKKLLDKF